MAQFFIRRPVFAWVIAIIIMLCGLMSINSLPVSQYPDVSPPQISISATYPGADAETLENSVTQVIEQQLTGLDGLLYFLRPAAPAARSVSTSPLIRAPIRISLRCRCKTRCSRRKAVCRARLPRRA